MYLEHDYEKHYEIKAGDTVIDLGAFNARHTVLYSRAVRKNGLVISLEPSWTNFIKVLNVIREFELENTMVLNAGIMKTSHIMELHLAEHPKGQDHTFYKEHSAPIEVCSMQKSLVLSLDDLVKVTGIEQIDFLKADIEGAEIEMVEGGKHALSILQNAAIASYHCLHCPKLVEDAFTKAGFTVSTEAGNPEEYTVLPLTYAWRE